MRYTEILEACWKGYRQAGMKKKGDRQVPNCVPVKEQTGDPFIDNAAKELLAMVLMFGVPFVAGVYIDLRNKLHKYQGREIIDALERKGVTMNRQTYNKVKPVLDRFDQALKDNDGAEAKALAKQIQQMIVMGKLSAPEPGPADTALAAKEKELAEDLKKWFKEKWVRFGPDGKIRGDCARGSESEGKPKCLPQSKAHALGKKGRASAAAKKRREDPNPERRGPARNVATKVNEEDMDEGWKQNVAAGILGATMALSPVPARAEIANMSPVQVQQSIKRAELAEKYAEVLIQRAKEDGRPIDTRMMNAIKAKASDMAAAQIQKQNAGQQTQQQNFPKQGSERMVNPNFNKFESKQDLDEKQDACYRKVKSRYKVWPSAYASGALVQCRKKGAANWGNKGKKK